MLYLELTVCVCFNHRLKCFLFFTYFKKRYKVTKLWLKITICSHPKCTKLEFSQKMASKCHTKKWFSGNFLSINYALLPNREWNQKQKHKKTASEQSGMLRIWRCDCALCVIGNEFPCRQPHNHSATLLRGLSTLPQG